MVEKWDMARGAGGRGVMTGELTLMCNIEEQFCDEYSYG